MGVASDGSCDFADSGSAATVFRAMRIRFSWYGSSPCRTSTNHVPAALSSQPRPRFSPSRSGEAKKSAGPITGTRKLAHSSTPRSSARPNPGFARRLTSTLRMPVNALPSVTPRRACSASWVMTNASVRTKETLAATIIHTSDGWLRSP